MKISNLNSWLTLAANFGVIAGLIFLGYEVRQNTVQMRTESSYSINEALSMLNAGVYNDPVFADVKVRGEADFNALNATERAQFIAYQFDRINLAIHYRALKKEGLSDIHFPYDQFLIKQFRTNAGLQQFLRYIEKDWEGQKDLFEEMLNPKE